MFVGRGELPWNGQGHGGDILKTASRLHECRQVDPWTFAHVLTPTFAPTSPLPTGKMLASSNFV